MNSTYTNVHLESSGNTSPTNTSGDLHAGTSPEQNAPNDLGRIYSPDPNEKQLTPRAIVIGSLVGSIVACTNIYIGLKIGWTFGASIVSAVLGFAIFSALRQNLSVLETNITQTAGSAAGSMASAAGFAPRGSTAWAMSMECPDGTLKSSTSSASPCDAPGPARPRPRRPAVMDPAA